jgi:excisionase family DNA binding protein
VTVRITVERAGAGEVRVTVAADIRISGDLGTLLGQPGAREESADPGRPGDAASAQDLLTVEQAAEALHVSRDKVYYLIRTRQLRSIKIGRSRRISRQWVAEFTAAQPSS